MKVSVGRVFLTILKVFLLLVATAMIKFQIPELRYDFGPKVPVKVESADELTIERFRKSTFASVRGKVDFTKAASFARHGVSFTYFLVQGYGAKLVVRTAEPVTEEWSEIDFHVGRLRPYRRMPFSRSVRAGFRRQFDVGIPEDALFLARDDVPQPSGWSIGATAFAIILWLVLAYFFFVHGLILGDRRKLGKPSVSLDGPSAHHAEPEPTSDEPGDNGPGADENAQ